MKLTKKQISIIYFCWTFVLLVVLIGFWYTFSLALVSLFLREKYLSSRCKVCMGRGVLYGFMPPIDVDFNRHQCYCCKGKKIFLRKSDEKHLLEKIEILQLNLSRELKKLRNNIKSYEKKYVPSSLLKDTNIEQINRRNIMNYCHQEDLIESCLKYLELAKKHIHVGLFRRQQLEIVQKEQSKIGDAYDLRIENDVVVSEINMEVKWFQADLPDFSPQSVLDETSSESNLLNNLIHEVNSILTETEQFLKVA